MSSPEHKQLIWNLIKDVKVGMLTTLSEEDNGSFHSRPMSLVQEAYDGTIYFFTHKDSAKVFEVKTEAREVGLTFSEPSNQVFVSLSGHAKITQDTALIDKYWSSGVEAWFPDGKNSRDVALLEIKIYKGEHWNVDENKLVQLFEFTKARLMNEKPDIGTNEKFGT